MWHKGPPRAQPPTVHSLPQPQTPSSPPHPAPPGWGGIVTGLSSLLRGNPSSSPRWWQEAVATVPPPRVACKPETESVSGSACGASHGSVWVRMSVHTCVCVHSEGLRVLARLCGAVSDPVGAHTCVCAGLFACGREPKHAHLRADLVSPLCDGVGV